MKTGCDIRAQAIARFDAAERRVVDRRLCADEGAR